MRNLEIEAARLKEKLSADPHSQPMIKYSTEFEDLAGNVVKLLQHDEIEMLVTGDS